MYKLLIKTTPAWVEAVLDDFDAFLIDHAACEKKASAMALSLIAHYSDKPDLVSAMIELSIEELAHFREVYKLMRQRDLILGPDNKDPYVGQLLKAVRQGTQAYFLDRLLIASIVEARGAERFGLVAEALPESPLKTFYTTLAQSEARHFELFLKLSYQYVNATVVDDRLAELLDLEATIISALPHRAALH